jgi:dTDP-4-amino-4,6-dideoxygalactose transaminase
MTSTADTEAQSETRIANPIPLVDLRLQHARVADETAEAVAEVMNSAAFVLGAHVAAFEAAYATYCGVAHCVGVGNGTDAIELSLRGLDLRPGDEVIIPANTFVATAEAVLRANCRLVLADCGEDYLIDPSRVAELVTGRTRVVVGVDLYGQVADMEGLRAAIGDDVAIVEDGAQSQGAFRNGRRAGSFGAAASVSFYPGKNLGAYGDAGAVLTEDAGLATRIQALRSHGGLRRYQHYLIGTNSRLDSIQAAILRVKLPYLDAWNEERRLAAETYRALLQDVDDVLLPVVAPGNTHVWHLFVIRIPRRDEVAERLVTAGIGAAIHYPRPVHQLGAFAGLNISRGPLPVSERLADQILSLPIFPGITVDQQTRVVTSLLRALRT